MDDVDIRIRLRGGRVAAAEAEAVAVAIDNVGDQASQASAKLAGLNAASAGLSGPMRGIGRAGNMAALGIGAAGAAVVGLGTFLGLKFNANMEQAATSFEHFLGSTKAARKYLNDLYMLAATTPFEFSDLVATTQQFLAFGYSATEARTMLTDLADAAAGLGKTGAQLGPVTLALGQIKAAGTLKGQDLNQLTSFGISATAIAKNLGMSYKEMRKEMEQGNVTSGPALKAIQKAMRDDFKGMAKEQSKTFTGQLSTLRDLTFRALGELSTPLFDKLRDDVFPWLNENMPAILDVLRDVGDGLGSAFKVGKGAVEDFLDAIKPAMPYVENVVLPVLKGMAIGFGVAIVGALKVALVLIKANATVLGFLGNAARPLRGVFTAIGGVISLVFGGAILKGISLVGKLGGVFRVFGGVARGLSVVIGGVGAALGAVFRIVGKVSGVFLSLGGRVLSAMTTGLSKVISFLGSLAGRFLSAGKRLGGSVMDGIKNAFGSGLGFVGDLGEALANSVIGFLNSAIPNSLPVPMGPDIPLPDNPIPALAAGGTITSAGAVLVGDEGPEILRLSKGARVDPLPKNRPLATAAASMTPRLIRIPITLNGRQLAEAVYDESRQAANRK